MLVKLGCLAGVKLTDSPVLCREDPYSLVLIVDLLLGQRGLGVLLQVMADPVECVHLLGAAG